MKEFLMGISLNTKISLVISSLIMVMFLIIQTCIVFGLCEPTLFLAKFGWGCIVFFIPPFFKVVIEFINNIKVRQEKVNAQLAGISQSNLVVTLTIDGYIIKANDNFCKLVGCTEGDMIKKPHSAMVTPEYAKSKEYLEFWETLRSGKSITSEFERVAKDGSKRWLYGNYTPIKNSNGEYDTVLKIATDVTAQHEAEEIVNQKNSYLEHAAKILRHDMHSGINTYMPRGLSSLRRRLNDEIIKELRIEAPLKMLDEGLKHTQKVYAGVKEFTNLVKEDVQLDTKAVDLKEILKNYLSSTSYSKQVVIDDLVTMDVNEALFCTAIDNLIRNGLKYNDSGTKTVMVFMEDDNTLCVQDNGRGMTQTEFENLSKPYIRKEGQKEGGSGLGLNICIAILKEHGFDITAEKCNPGTKLRIKLK
jgi:PAS domain S-box-containing protein